MDAPARDNLLDKLNDLLHARGITDATITKYGLTPAAGLYGAAAAMQGWRFYTIAPDGHKALRWKNAQHVEPRYQWAAKDEPHAYTPANALYSAGGLTAAAQESSELYWCEGEPDVWTLHSAFVNDPMRAAWATTYYGTADALPAHLQNLFNMGYSRIVCYPDCDEAGMQYAYRLQQAAASGGPAVAVKRLPGEMGSGFDLNDLWRDCKFDANAFTAALMECPPIPDVDLWLYAHTAPDGNKVSSDLPASWWRDQYRAYIAAVEKALGEPTKREGQTPRWHCPLPVHDDAHPSFTISRSRNPDFPWPVCTCGIHFQSDAWEQVGRAVLKQSFADFYRPNLPARAPAPAAPVVQQARANGNPPTPVSLPATVVSWDEAARDYAARQRAETVPATPPTICPIKSIHEFGGQCRVWDAGKMTVLVGASGSTKTSFLESLVVEPLRRAGTHVLLAGGEWKPYEMVGRAVQRHGGPSRTAQSLWEVYRWQVANGVPERERLMEGCLTAAQQADSDRIVRETLLWPGKLFMLPSARLDIPTLVETARQFVIGAPLKPAVLVVDYMQLYAFNASIPLMQQVVMLKSGLEPTTAFPGLHVVLATQVTKEAARLLRRRDQALDVGDAQEMREDPVNLALSLKPDVILNANDEFVRMAGTGQVFVLKNSEGRRGKVRLLLNAARLAWEDKVIIDDPVGGIPV